MRLASRVRALAPGGVDVVVDFAGGVRAGQLTVPIARTFTLEEAADAFRASMTGHVSGKIAIQVSR